MRALLFAIIGTLSISTTVFAQNIDYTSLAGRERNQLIKCFSDMLTVIKRHNLREYLLEFLEAGCAAEMQDYQTALRPNWPKEVQESKDDAFYAETVRKNKLSQLANLYIIRLVCQNECMKMPSSAATLLIAALEDAAVRLYKDRAVSFCSGDSCALDNYRKCLLFQMPTAIANRTKPRDFEQIAQQICGEKENMARGVLTIDFANAQKLQQQSGLSEITRNIIDSVITTIRHQTVVSYAEDLTKVEPNRKSCKLPMCGDRQCISMQDEPEYNCAINN